MPETETQETQDETETGEQETPETYPAEVVKDLRRENAKYRTKAKKADDYAHRLHTELVRHTGRLADPADLVFDETHLDDPEKLDSAITELLTRKPHLRARKINGDVGQGRLDKPAAPADFSRLFSR